MYYCFVIMFSTFNPKFHLVQYQYLHFCFLFVLFTLFSTSLYLFLMCFSLKLYISEFCTLIQSGNLGILMEDFNPFTFSVTTDIFEKFSSFTLFTIYFTLFHPLPFLFAVLGKFSLLLSSLAFLLCFSISQWLSSHS